MRDNNEWIKIYTYEEKPKSLNDYYVMTDGCGCCATDKRNPTKEDLDILEKHLNEQMELISYIRDKYGLN